MSDTVYIVTSGDYSDYRIRAIFKDYEKAKVFCRHFDGCRVEQYCFEDNDNWIDYNYAEAYLEARLEGEPSVICHCRHEYMKYDTFHCRPHNAYTLHDGCLTVLMIRRLPDGYSEQHIIDQYAKIWQDILAELKDVVSDLDLDSIKQRAECAKRVKEYLNRKLEIEDNVNDYLQNW